MKRSIPQNASAGVDWDEIHRRLHQAREALDGIKAPADTKEILKSRARQLAQAYQGQTAAEQTLEMVEFLLGHESYAIELAYIREVSTLRELTPLPGTPAFVLGIIHLRGRILSVIAINRFFDLPQREPAELDKLIIVGNGPLEFGILADAIIDVRSVPLAMIQPPLPTLTGINQGYLKGITGERVVILDTGRLLSDNNIIVHEEPEA